MCETVFYNSQLGAKYNVMVFNLSIDYGKSLNDVVFYGSATLDGEPAPRDCREAVCVALAGLGRFAQSL